MIPQSYVEVIATRANEAIPAGAEVTVTHRLNQRGPFTVRRIRGAAELGAVVDAAPVGTPLPATSGNEAAANTMPTLERIQVAMDVSTNQLQSAPYSMVCYAQGGALMFEPPVLDTFAPGVELTIRFINNNAVAVRNIRLELFGAYAWQS